MGHDETGAEVNGCVLLAHDDGALRAVFRDALKRWSVETFDSGRALVQRIGGLGPDVIVVRAGDVPDTVSLVCALREGPSTRDAAIVLLVPATTRELRVQGLAAGADQVLVEPVTADEILTTTEVLLERARARQHREEQYAATHRELQRRVDEQQALLDVIPVGIGIATDRACREIRINKAFAATLGLTTDDNASKTAPPGERPTNFRVLGADGAEIPGTELPMQRAAREGVELREIEFDIVHADGRVHRLLEYVAPLFDEAGQPRGAVGAFVDVTAGRHAQRRDQLLLRLDDAVRTAVEPASVARAFVRLLASDMRASAVILNEVIDRARLRTETIARFVSGDVMADAGVAADAGGADLRQRLLAGETVPALLNPAGTSASGEPKFVAGIGVTLPVFRHDQLVALLSLARPSDPALSARDIDLSREAAVRCWSAIERARVTRSLRESEERYRRIFDTAGVSIWEEDFSEVKAELDRLRDAGVSDLERYIDEHPEFVNECMHRVRVVNVNDASVRLFGAPDKEALLESLSRVFEAETHRVFAGELRALVRGERRFDAESALRTLDGRTIHAMVSVTFPEERDAFRSVLVSLGDITARKAAETALQRLYEDLEQANRLKDDFLATLSHELRTPLNAVLGWAQMLRTGAVAPEVRGRALESLERNARAQAKIVEDLLDVSRIVSGKLQIKSEPVDLAAIVSGAVDTVRPAAVAKSVALHLSRETGVRLTVTGDEDRLQQVVWNLLSNAIKFTPEGGRVDVRVQRSERLAEIVVTDTGEGIAPSFQQHLFERFRQRDSSIARRHGGLGLGLSIVRHLTEAHGGTVSARSDGEDRGATFSVALPLRAVEQASGPADGLAGREPAATSALDGLRALVVDDDADARDLLRYVLQSRGGHVETAGSVREALGAVELGVFDVVIADIGMPDQDGYDLVRTLRRSSSPTEAIPMVAVTAYASVAERDEALRAGYDAHLAKPVDPDHLIHTIAAITAGRLTRTRRYGSHSPERAP